MFFRRTLHFGDGMFWDLLDGLLFLSVNRERIAQRYELQELSTLTASLLDGSWLGTSARKAQSNAMSKMQCVRTFSCQSFLKILGKMSTFLDQGKIEICFKQSISLLPRKNIDWANFAHLQEAGRTVQRHLWWRTMALLSWHCVCVCDLQFNLKYKLSSKY